MWVELAAAFVMAVASAAIRAMLTPKPEIPQPGKFSTPEIDPNRNIPVVFGTFTVNDPSVVWYGDLSVSPVYPEDGKK